MNRSLLNVSSSALKQLSNILKNSNKKYIFFDLKSGGCNGFEYRFTATDKIFNKKMYMNKII